ncbi:hypothetical protein B0A50_01628 [Salinomyces thailandicus]|uniref:WD40 repeat-like protein n=1 Tax=Salinomyces thailandicus TaxID=706561 RepID=A0A4U0UAV1_9PEZI|nr:hypothetical protein B0A50_01628 [Salinomyces thailandica]
MPTTQTIAKEHASPVSPKSKQQFSIPDTSHLLITTPSFIQAWDSKGIHTIFQSSRSGIVAAREAKDDSGVLAVADRHVVVLHDTKRGQEQSWGLNADENEEVRHLEYTRDAKCLFLSTSLTNDIQRYSTEHVRVLSSSQAHHSAPVALGVSPSGHLMVSASDDPPCVYVKNLSYNSSPVLLEPRASEAAVCAVAFHPERPNIFLLGFRDGTLAAYDGTRVGRKQHGTQSNQGAVNDGEVARFMGLHRTTAKAVTKTGISIKPASISRAAFLQGYKTRAVSVGSDGRCRLVDFADGGIILRTWHAKAPLTSVSVLSIKSTRAAMGPQRRSVSASSYIIGGPTSTNNLIAVSRADGKVHIYDSVGLLLAQKTVSENGERVIGVEWAKGPSPRPIPNSGGVQEDVTDAPSIPLRVATPQEKSPLPEKSPSVQPKSQARRRTTTPYRLGLPPELRRPDARQSARGDRKFTIHPDEAEEGTVRHTPAAQREAAVPVQTGNYLDLFSPVKPPNTKPDATIEQPVASSPRGRPRISSQTFVKSPEPAAKPDNAAKAGITEVRESTAKGSGSDTAKPAASISPKQAALRGKSTRISPLKKRQISFKTVARPTSRAAKNSSPGSTAVPANDNAKVLADLRKMGATTQKSQHRSVLAPPATHNHGKSFAAVSHPFKPPGWVHPPRLGPAIQKAWHPGNVLEREITWPTDSFQDQSQDEDDDEDDIWLTSDTDKEGKNLRRRRLADMPRPPARQTSRSKVDSVGTYSTAGEPKSPRPAPDGRPPGSMDGSTEESERYGTARSHLSPKGDLVVSSTDVRQLFPRTSSLSPNRKQSPRKRIEERSPRHERALQEITGNTLGRPQRSPWARAEAAKKKEQTPVKHAAAQEVQRSVVPNDSVLATAALVRSPTMRCFQCADTGTRVTDLEDEVARLRGEMLAMKAAMRRHGVPLPASVRGTR